MPTLNEIVTGAAALLNGPGGAVTAADFIVNGQNIAILLLNQIRRQAEMAHDFNFQRKLLTLSVDSSTGGSLDAAVLYGTATTAEIKTVVEMGTFDTNGNLRPIEWTTVEEGLERDRKNRVYRRERLYLTDDQAQSACGLQRLTLANSTVYNWPKSPNTTTALAIGIEAYVFDSDWTTADLAPTVTVTGTLSPSATGTYTYIGTYADYPMYTMGDNFFVSYSPADIAYTIHAPGEGFDDPTNGWIATGTTLAGTYNHAGTATGTATVSAASGTTSNIWTTHAAQFLLWSLVVQLNHRFKFFVYRIEGNLPPPQTQADSGLEAFILWDSNRFEEFRRHSR